MCLKTMATSSAPSPTKRGDYTINQFESDLMSFYDYCKENRLTDDDISKICEPLAKTIKPKSFLSRSLMMTFFVSISILTLLYLLSYNETIAWHYSAFGRILLINTLPLYDWRHLKNEKCLIDRSIETNEFRNTYDCTYCETIKYVTLEYDLDQDYIKERYIDMNVPVVLLDSIRNWPYSNNDKDKNLIHDMIRDDAIYYSYPCKLSTNLHKELPIGITLEKSLRTYSYFIHFENCDFDVTKAFRPYAPRPLYLHPDISPIQYNWLMASKNYNVTRYKRFRLNERIAIIGQITGGTMIRLIPGADCYVEEECDALDISLNEGDSLLFTSVWDVEYKPRPDAENVAILLETR